MIIKTSKKSIVKKLILVSIITIILINVPFITDTTKAQKVGINKTVTVDSSFGGSGEPIAVGNNYVYSAGNGDNVLIQHYPLNLSIRNSPSTGDGDWVIPASSRVYGPRGNQGREYYLDNMTLTGNEEGSGTLVGPIDNEDSSNNVYLIDAGTTPERLIKYSQGFTQEWTYKNSSDIQNGGYDNDKIAVWKSDGHGEFLDTDGNKIGSMNFNIGGNGNVGIGDAENGYGVTADGSNVYLYDFSDGSLIGSIPRSELGGSAFNIHSVDLSPNAEYIYIGVGRGDTDNGDIYEYDRATLSKNWVVNMSGYTYAVDSKFHNGYLQVYGGTFDGTKLYLERINTSTINPQTLKSELSGYAIDEKGNKLENVRINNNRTVEITTTNKNGFYNITLTENTYDLRADKLGYYSDIKTVNLSSDISNFNFTLEAHNFADPEKQNSTQVIELQANNWMFPNTTQKYRVYLYNKSGKHLVTNQTNVSVWSENKSVVEVNESKAIIQSKNVTDTATVRANLTDTFGSNVTVYNDSANITVGKRTLKNIEEMPPEQYIPSLVGVDRGRNVTDIGDPEDKTSSIGNSPLQWILALLIIGVVFTHILDSCWVGLGIITLGIVPFWIADWVNFATMISTVFFGLFIAVFKADTGKGNSQEEI